jgi:hypothetical protein
VTTDALAPTDWHRPLACATLGRTCQTCGRPTVAVRIDGPEAPYAVCSHHTVGAELARLSEILEALQATGLAR